MKGKKNECKQYSHSNFSSKLPREVIDKAVINSVKLIDPSFKEKIKKKKIQNLNQDVCTKCIFSTTKL